MKYDRSGIQFMYPDNWKVVDEQLDGFPRSVTVQSPSGAFWSLDIHPFSVRSEDLINEMVQAIADEYDDVESEPVEETVEEYDATGADLYWSCLDFVIKARLRSFKNGHATYVTLYQAEDRDFDEFEAVFRAMTHSLLNTAAA